MQNNSLNDHNNHQYPDKSHQDQSTKQFSQYVIDYQKRVDKILHWLFEKNRHLEQRPDQSVLNELSFNELLDEYNLHEKFITDFYDYIYIIMRCKEDGIEMRDNEALNEEDRDEVGIQVDTMEVCYEKLRILSSDRLNVLKRLIEGRQSNKIERFEEWLSSMEKKISCHNNIGPDCNSIEKQLLDMDKFREELEQKQHFLEFMSNVIIFDDIDSESMQVRSGSCESLNHKLENINSRWETICKFVNNHTSKLQRAKTTWDLLEDERPKLLNWLKEVNENLCELTKAATAMTDTQSNNVFVDKLMSQCEKMDCDIKMKQTIYTSLERRTRIEIEAIDDKYSMFIIELEKALEEIQENWNSMMYQKRMLDYQLHAISNKEQETNCIIDITTQQNTTSDLSDQLVDSTNNHSTKPLSLYNNLDTRLELNDFSSNDSPSASNEDQKGSSLQLYSSFSDQRPLNDSSNILRLANDIKSSELENELYSQDELSVDSLSATYHIDDIVNETTKDNNQPELVYSVPNHIINSNHQFPIIDVLDGTQNNNQQRDATHHNCRVEEWRQSLESLSNWLKRIEALLGIDETLLGINNDASIQSWSQTDPHQQLLTILDIEKQINSPYQDEFDCLILQGQQIISDLIPEIDGNAYEANLKEILSDIEIRFGSVRRCLGERKVELADKARWQDLAKKLKTSSEMLIGEMGNIIAETTIGVDLITLAQQQDELIRSKSNLDNNLMVQSSIQDANMFLKMCDTIQQHIGHHVSSPSNNNNHYPEQIIRSSEIGDSSCSSLDDMWSFLRDLKDDVETKLDRLTLHYSELSQLIEDRLERLDEVHKEMHALQHSMQELSKQLQVAEILRSNWGSLDDLAIEQLSEQLEDLKLFRERISEISNTHELMNSIVDWMTQSDVPLSQQNLKRISELNTIWSLIQVSSDERQKLIEIAFDNLGASEQKFLTLTLSDLPNWERRVAASKVPYFIDHTTNKTKWDHPKFTNMLNTLNSVHQVVYSAYRTALKLRIVQKILGIDLIMLDSLKEILDSFNFNQTNSQSRNSISGMSSNEILVDVEQVILVLKQIYTKIQTDEKPQLDVPLSIDLTLNWLLNLYDATRTGFISVLSLKVGLLLMCCATREEKYNFMYDLIANPRTLGVDGRRLGTLFEICMRIPIYLGEGESFGGTGIIENSIRDCFSKSKFNPEQPNCIEKTDYSNWLRSEPQFIIWLPVLHRLLVSENISHQIKCKLCKTNPITGLRYRCLKCFNYNICQNCFLTGRHIGEHYNPITHPMQEYCCQTGSGTKVRDLGKILRNKLKPSR